MSNKWNRLDNMAIIFPAALKGTNTQVFRISCELFAKIEPQFLQNALEETIQVFSVFQSILKPGLFWFYLESTDIMPIVHEEDRQPCAPIYNHNQKSLLFDVSYYKNRVNLEVFHVLSDATGAMHFLRALITKYLSQCHHLDEPSIGYDASVAQMSDDSFNRYYTGSKNTRRVCRKVACCLRGRKYPENRLKIITGLVGIEPLLEEAHRHHTTLTIFLCACLMKAINETVPVRSTRRPVILTVPVNLRKHFPSTSARNFFGLLEIEYDFWNRSDDFEDILNKIKIDFDQGLSNANLAKDLDANSALEHNFFARITPLFVKNLLLKAVCNYSAKDRTAGFSNIGIISMPHELESFIRSFDLCSGTDSLQVCLCSFQRQLSISFSSPFVDSEIPRRFFRFLAELGADIEITVNLEENSEDMS